MFDYERLKKLMKENGYGCNSLADKVGVTHCHMSRIINGLHTNLRLSTLDKICETLGCKPSDLLK